MEDMNYSCVIDFKMKQLIICVFSITFSSLCLGQLYSISEPKRLPSSVNTSAEETTPVLSPNGNELHFVRTFDQNNLGGSNDQDCWKAQKNEKGEWQQAENVSEFNNELNNGLVSFSSDGKTAYLLNSYGGKSTSLKGIAYANLDINGEWGKPKLLALELDEFEGNTFGFAVSGDQKTIVISGQLKNNTSKADLFISELKEGIWSKPLKLGFNTSKNEISPFLSQHGDTLYFASNGLVGLGNYDIFYSTRKEQQLNWNIPENMGNSINSTDFDAYFFKKDKNVFWSSNRGSTEADIYFAELKTPSKLSIALSKKDVSIFNGNDGEIELSINSGNPPFKYKWSNGSMVEDLFQLRKGSYQVEVVDAIGQKVNETIEILEPKPILRTSFRLPEVRFEFDSWNFSSDKDYDSLNVIADLLNKYPGMIAELISHTDSRGDEKSNMKLSENRARAVYTYLVEKKGIDPRRMIPIGKGETEPVRYIDSKTNQYATLTEAYIDSYKNSDINLVEQLHQLNRRLEGRIISYDFNPNTAPAAPKDYLLQPK